MSYPWMPPIYNVNGRATQWINGIVTSHDIFCGCDKPFYHLFYLLNKKGGFNQLSIQEENQIKKCLGLTTAETQDAGTSTADAPGIDENLDFGDLEKLFEEDGTSENAG